jgi:hypothetical protein
MTTALARGRRLCAVVSLVVTAAHAGEPEPGRFLAFVGQKIKVEQFTPTSGCKQPEVETRPDGTRFVCVEIPNAAFHAEYRVLKMVYGQYGDAAIRFDAFDHYGWPAFARYDQVLLFMSRRDDGSWIHEKYQYYPVYETQDGDWAACGSADQFEPPARRGPSTARPMAFRQPVVESLADLRPEQIEAWFPAPDWQRVDDMAICRQGTPLAELFEAKKRGVLKARGLFD